MNAHWSQKLESLDACSKAVEYASTQPDLQTAWDNCQRGDWMLWLLGRTNADRRALVGCAATCASLALPIWQARYPNDSRVADCLDACRKYARGEIDDAELRKHRSASYAAATTAIAYAASYAAAYASYTAEAASYAAAYASYTAEAASYAAAHAVAVDRGDGRAARSTTLAQCADIVRRHFPKAPKVTP